MTNFVHSLRILLAAAIVVSLLAAVAVAKSSPKRRQLNLASRKAAEQLLSDLGYWTGPVDGRWDTVSRNALIAFQKAEERERTGVLTAAELEALREASPITPRETGEAHFEIDITRQIIYHVDEAGAVSRILPISSGTEKYYEEKGGSGLAYTPRGRFKIYHKISGWRKSPLGMLYYPSYYTGGIAVHGSTSVPVHPASHGCVRVPMYAAQPLYEMMPVGSTLLVYD